MYKLFIFVAVFCISNQLDAQALKKRDVPAAVKAKVSNLYPNVSGIEWSKEDSMYEATFSMANNEIELLLAHDGSLKMTETDIDIATLPSAITDYVKRNHLVNAIDEASIRNDAYGVVTYEVEVQTTQYIFSKEGEMLSKEVDDAEKE